jgi:hypothetical protein
LELNLIHPIVPAGFRIAATGLFRRAFGHRTYAGDAQQICRKIVRACFDETRGCYMTSPRTYRDFWARDFGRCVPSLIYLGFRDEVISTFRYALHHYRRGGKFSLVIHPSGGLFDFPAYAPDGFAFFLHGLVQLHHPSLVDENRRFLEQEVRRFYITVVHKKTGLVRTDRRFSEAQDYADRKGSCYSTVMCHLVSRAADALQLQNPLAKYDYPALIRGAFWNGEYFYDDLQKRPYLTGDACILPFWADAVPQAQSAFPIVSHRMDEAGLTSPSPLRYGTRQGPKRPMIWLDRVNPWQRNAVWTCLGVQYLEVLKRFDVPRYLLELSRLEALVERLHCFPEVLEPTTLTLFESAFYRSEDSMLWAADLLAMLVERDAD